MFFFSTTNKASLFPDNSMGSNQTHGLNSMLYVYVEMQLKGLVDDDSLTEQGSQIIGECECCQGISAVCTYRSLPLSHESS